MNEYKIIPRDQVINIPASVAVCPYCGGCLSVKLDTWTQLDDGLWGVDEDETPGLDCETEPDLDDGTLDRSEWEIWADAHSKMPYVYQMPVEIKVAKWLNEHCRFDMEVSIYDRRD